MTFQDWPKVELHASRVLHVDLTEQLYVVELGGRKWTIAASRVFATKADAEAEKVVHEAFNRSCFQAPELDLLPQPLHGRVGV